MYYENFLAHHTNKDGVWFCNGAPVSMNGLKNALKKASPAERKKIKETVAKEKERVVKEKLKRDLVKHPERLYKHKNELSREEVDAIVKEIQWDKSIKDVSDAAHKKNLERIVDLSRNIASFGTQAWNLYSTTRNFIDAFENQRKSDLAQRIRKEPKLAKDYKYDFTESEMTKILAGEGWTPKSGGKGNK